MAKKILIVDDSALMRRMLCDIIQSDKSYEVSDIATNGEEALELIMKNLYDAILMDINMPKKNGIEVLKELKQKHKSAKIIVVSSLTKEGADITLQALELGAISCVHKPASILDARAEEYKERLLEIVKDVTHMRLSLFSASKRTPSDEKTKVLKKEHVQIVKNATGSKLVAIACSTGGPKALQSVIPKLPANLDAPVVVVQHMPQGFTASLAERLDNLSEISVKEAAEGDVLTKGCVYIARGGKHLKLAKKGSDHVVTYSDEPTREGVKPCANYMYESICNTDYNKVVCVVMTGMGADGTEGISNLMKNKTQKELMVIAQNESSCIVYGMPKSVVKAELADEIVPLDGIAKEIITNVGVR